MVTVTSAAASFFFMLAPYLEGCLAGESRYYVASRDVLRIGLRRHLCTAEADPTPPEASPVTVRQRVAGQSFSEPATSSSAAGALFSTADPAAEQWPGAIFAGA
jgi:hypothetical protein